MLLRERFERTGDVLFRLRGALPLLALVEVPLAFPGPAAGASPLAGHSFELLCLLLGLLGLGIRFWVVGAVAKGSSGRNTRRQRAHALNTSGAYAVVRNPLYLANFLCWTAVSLLLRDPRWIAFNALLFFAFYLPIVYREEAFLEATFGDAYREYASRVPCLIPDPAGWRPSEQPFNLRRALRREHDGLLSLVAALAVVDGAYHELTPASAPLEMHWLWWLCGAFLIWAPLKLAKKGWLEWASRRAARSG